MHILKNTLSHRLLAVFLALGCMIAPYAHGSEATNTSPEVAGAEKVLQSMIKALLANDYRAFLAPGAKELSGNVSEYRFSILREDSGPALKGGYTAAYDLEVPEADGSINYHWTITARKSGDELRAILRLKDGKALNFNVQ